VAIIAKGAQVAIIMSLTYAIGDIHGSLAKLRRLVARCDAHAAGRDRTFVFLGDYIDRGADSAGVIGFLIDLQAALPTIALMGNHEAMALAVIDDINDAQLWLPQGGAATLESYGVDRPRDLPRVHVDWLRALPLRHDDGRRLFVHAGIDPDKPLDAQADEDLLWIREPFLSDRRDLGRLIVHGHTPTPGRRPERRGSRLGLDTGAVYGGPLTAAVFADSQTEPIGVLTAD
jgi:serine/threonine protein phosphatase 1